jgi:ferric-dicitrate binding protein FerR (iron transport regulator)
VGRGKQIPLVNVDEEWQRFLTRVGQQKVQTTGFSWIRIAAALLLIAAAGFIIVLFLSQPGETRFETASETERIELPDGSVVTLNRNSTLTFSEDFNADRRAVRLSGEAFFDVAPDMQKRFVITSDNAVIEVVGTTFNVSAYDKDPQLTVTVESGKVRFTAPSSQQTVDLGPGHVGTYSKSDRILRADVNTDVNYDSWSTQHIEFEATPLPEAVRILNKTYGSSISITGTIPDTCFVTVIFDRQTLEAVLRVLETTLNLTYRIDGDKIEITSAGC